VGRKPEARPASRRTETAYKARPKGESAQHDEAHWHEGNVNAAAQHDEAHWHEGNVNAAVVQGKFTHLIWGDLSGIGWGRTLA